MALLSRATAPVRSVTDIVEHACDADSDANGRLAEQAGRESENTEERR